MWLRIVNAKADPTKVENIRNLYNSPEIALACIHHN
jgi:hypothetical protein